MGFCSGCAFSPRTLDAPVDIQLYGCENTGWVEGADVQLWGILVRLFPQQEKKKKKKCQETDAISNQRTKRNGGGS